MLAKGGAMKTGMKLLWVLSATAGAAALAQVQAPEAVLLMRPPFAQTLAKSSGKPTALRLVKSSERRHPYEEDSVWLNRHGLKLPYLKSDLPNDNRGDIPPTVPETLDDLRLVHAIPDGRRLQLIYGPDFSGGSLLAAYQGSADSLLYQFDFSRYLQPPNVAKGEAEFVEERIQWAQAAGDLLLVSNFHRTYAKSSKGQNGYLNALEPKSGKLRWRSRPLVCNSANFVVAGDAVISGYGFTAEKDFLYVLDRRTGAIVQTVPVRSGPEWLILKDGKLFVRTYNTDYVFRLKAK